MKWTFYLLLCSLAACCRGVAAADEASPPILSVPAESMVVVQVFAPEKLAEMAADPALPPLQQVFGPEKLAEMAADPAHPLQQAAQNRLRRLQLAYKCSDPTLVHYAVKNAQGEPAFLTETTPADTIEQLELYLRAERQRMVAKGVAPEDMHLYIRGDFSAPWRRVALLTEAATRAGFEHIIMTYPFHENGDGE